MSILTGVKCSELQNSGHCTPDYLCSTISSHKMKLEQQVKLCQRCGKPIKRIWPLCNLFGIFSYYVILAEDEERPVDSEAVLLNRYGVVYSHCSGSLSHRLLVDPGAGWGDWRPDAPSPSGKIIFEASHSRTAQILLKKSKLTLDTRH